MLKIQSIFNEAFSEYGRIVTGYEFSEMIRILNSEPKPVDGVTYEPSRPEMERLSVFAQLRDGEFGGLPIQIGYCNGTNTALTCLEYHRNSEINVYSTDVILLLGRLQDVKAGKYDTTKVEAFLAPAGSAVEVYATTLHYAPCDAREGAGFRAAIILPKGTNTEKPNRENRNEEDKLLFARNKWLLASLGTDEAEQGACVCLSDNNIHITY